MSYNFRLIISGTIFFSILTTMIGCSKKEINKNSIQIKGSDTEVNLVQRLSEAYMEKLPEVSIAITGGGSGTGIAALINKQTDIANSSRSMKNAEIEQAKAKGVEPIPIIFALDGLAIITHESLSVNSLNINEVADIFKGNIINWRTLGGPDLEISMYGRQSNSGTFVYFRDTVLKGDYATNVRRMNGTAQIVEAVRKDKAGIGYVGIGYVVNEEGNVISEIKIQNLAKDADSPPVSPLESKNVKSGAYPLSRPLFQYTNGMPAGGLLEFVQFELSQEGQTLIENEGYYPITDKHMEHNRSLGLIK
ncbi:MAG: PstS family phosphate ABC transporter substrate-binding protein [Candidatus Scalinduaceae bacterium]